MIKFESTALTDEEREFQRSVRGFLDEHLDPDRRPALGMAGARSREFSRAVAERGWVGMAIPSEYGGNQGTAVQRFILAEEMFGAGAPVSGHWVGDRQTAQMLLSFGTEDQRQRFLPAICRGECWFAIGMSEPDAGSDLAAVRTSARQVEGGWLVNGTKVWTSGAAENDFFVVLLRTSPRGEDRHEGLSQMIVDLRSEGVTISPITTLDGSQNFAEVVLTDVFVPDSMVLGEIGNGWRQVTGELGYERAGPERYLSPYQVLLAFLREHDASALPADAVESIGRIAARFASLRAMSLSIARAIDRGQTPAAEAALFKDTATTFEQSVVTTLQALAEVEPHLGSESRYESMLAEAILMSPSWTIRGGTSEALRTVAARALLRAVTEEGQR